MIGPLAFMEYYLVFNQKITLYPGSIHCNKCLELRNQSKHVNTMVCDVGLGKLKFVYEDLYTNIQITCIEVRQKLCLIQI